MDTEWEQSKIKISRKSNRWKKPLFDHTKILTHYFSIGTKKITQEEWNVERERRSNIKQPIKKY